MGVPIEFYHIPPFSFEGWIIYEEYVGGWIDLRLIDFNPFDISSGYGMMES